MSGHTLPVLEVGTVRADHHWTSSGCHVSPVAGLSCSEYVSSFFGRLTSLVRTLLEREFEQGKNSFATFTTFDRSLTHNITSTWVVEVFVVRTGS